MRCPVCGKEISSGERRCSSCGFRLPEEERISSGNASSDAAVRSGRSSAGAKKRRKKRGSGAAVIALFVLTGILGLAVLGGGGYFLGRRIGLFASSPSPSAVPASFPTASAASPMPAADPTPAAELTSVPGSAETPEHGETAAPQPTSSAVLQGSETWRQLCFEYIDRKQYMDGSSPEFYDTQDPGIRFTLYDMDGNGTPELIAENGAETLADAAAYVFTFEGDRILFLGEVGSRELEFYAFDSEGYPGLFCTDGNNDVFTTCYYFLENGTVHEEDVLEEDYNGLKEEDDEVIGRQLTKDDNLFLFVSETAATDRNYLSFYSRDEILSMGWDSFVILCGIGE